MNEVKKDPPNLSSLKANDFDAAFDKALSVRSENAILLVPVGRWIMQRADVIEELSRWREASAESFFAQFPRSRHTFAKYLKIHSIETINSILFLIMNEDRIFQGHVGLKNVCGFSAEVDAVMVGPQYRGSGIARDALTSLLWWASAELNIRKFDLEVVSTNVAAMSLYESLGFRIASKSSLGFQTTDSREIPKGIEQTDKTIARIVMSCINQA